MKPIYSKLNSNASYLQQLDFIIEEIAKHMLDKLNCIKIDPSTILDLGYGLGIDYGFLQKLYPRAKIYAVDIAINMFKQYKLDLTPNTAWFKRLFNRRNSPRFICADSLFLPINYQSIDLVWSNLTLAYINDIKQYFLEINRILKLGGTFVVSGLGVDSLKQLRLIGLATYNFPDMHLIGDILVEVGFSNVVTDMEYIKLEYDDFDQLLTDIRLFGCGFCLGHKISREIYSKLEGNFESLTVGGKIPLTLEIFYAHAWKDEVRKSIVGGRQVIKFMH